jgi:acetylornithine deacetylase
VVAEQARAAAEHRILPKYRSHAPEANIETEVLASYPGLVLDPNSPAIAFLRELSGANRVGTVAYGTEAGLFQKAGIPAVVCGPGSIEQAHKADEFLALSQLSACEALLARIIARLSA